MTSLRNSYHIVQNFVGINFWQMKLENTFGLGYFGGWAIIELALLFEVDTLKGKFLAAAGESTKFAKILPSKILRYMVISLYYELLVLHIT